MIQIIPTIYIKQGKALLPNHNSEYEFLNESPLELAINMKSKGIKSIEIIDIDGVETDEIVNFESIKLIKNYTNLEIYFGGGVNNDDEVRLAIEYGADKVIFSSIALKRADLFTGWLLTYGRNKIVLGVDILADKVHGNFMKDESQVDALEYINGFYKLGLLYVKCSSISASNNGSGADISLFNKIKNRLPDIKIIAAGGVQSTEEIDFLREMNIFGVNFGRAWYNKNLNENNLSKYLI